MEQLVKENKNHPVRRRWSSAIIILVMVSGLASSLFAGISADLRSRDYLQGRAQTIADTLPAEAISFLDGEADDVNKFEYKQVKAMLERVKANNSDLSYVYLMRNQQAAPIFLVDAAPSTSEDFSPPGEVYNETSRQLRSGFSSAKSFVEGPSRDRGGIWLSALAPVNDPSTNQTVAWVGIDTPALSYYFDVVIYALVPLFLAAIPLAGLLRDRKLADKEWEITELKQQFVSIASHELRSPMSGMIWALQSLLKTGSDNLTDKQKILLTDMFQSSQSSMATINEILDLSVFEHRHTDSERHDLIELVSVIGEIQKTLSLVAQERNITISTDHFPETAYTQGDLLALKRALMNVVSNALKYSFEGSTVKITYRLDNGEHIISVKDHGIGIPAKDLPHVLSGYHRGSNTSKSQTRGTGLGLWMTKLIIDNHRGRLWITSQEDEGTTIFIALPLHKLGDKLATKPA